MHDESDGTVVSQPDGERSEKELTVLRMMYAVSLKLGEQMRAAADFQLDQHEVMALGLINQRPGLTQTDLARALSLSAVQVSRLVDDLEGHGLAERRAHKFDRRSKDLHPTEAGQDMYGRMRRRSLELAQEVFRETPDERLNILSAQAVRITERLGLNLLAGRPSD